MSIPERILLVSAVIVALGVIRAALKGTRRVLRTADRLVTLLTEMTAQLGGTPNAFEILEQIIAQFRTDSGSSLRDQINSLTDSVAGLTEAARTAERVASLLEDRVETVRQVASDERRQHARDQASIMRLLQHLEGTVATGAATGLRMEIAAFEVADDLAADRERAESVPDEAPSGAKADAASHEPSD